MATLTEYTSYAEVRAVLGVSPEELEDATLALAVYSAALTADIEDVNLGIPDQFAAVAAVAADSRTPDQVRFYDTVRLFATYAVARQLSSSLPLFGPKDISDGKASFSRFADSPYKATIAEVRNQFDRLRTRLDTAYSKLSAGQASSVALNVLSIAGLPTDPVTGS